MPLPNTLTINSIKITHGINGTEWNLVSDDQSKGYLEQIQFEEGMFGTIPSGTIILRDVGDALSDFNFSGKDKIDFNITERGWTGQNLDGIADTYNFSFIIYQTSQGTDFGDKTQPRLITLKFIDFSYFVNERRTAVPDEFVDIISTEEKSTSATVPIKKGFVNSLIKYLYTPGIPFNIDSAKNYAWLKPNTPIFPSGRKITQSNTLSLLNYMAENAVNDKNRSNFFFWQDLHGVNFKSLDKLTGPSDPVIPNSYPIAQVYTTAKTDSVYVAQISDPVFGDTSIVVYKIDSISFSPSYSFMELENSGFFASYYDRIDPDFDNPYFMFSDDNVGFTRNQIQYNVNKQTRFGGPYWDGIFENFEFTTQNFNDPTSTEGIIYDTWNLIPGGTKGFVNGDGAAYKGDFVSKRNHDEQQWGFIDTSYYNRSIDEPSYSMFTEQGITMIDLESNRLSTTMWQAMYDIQELNPIIGITYKTIDEASGEEGTTFINKNIIEQYIYAKQDYKKERDKYYKNRKLKEQWNLFKYVVCCIDDSEDSFYAMILGATYVGEGPNIVADPLPEKSKAFKYAWKEIQFYPSEYEGISGATFTTIRVTEQQPMWFGSGSTAGCTCGIPFGLSGATGITLTDYIHPFFDAIIEHNSRSGGFSGTTFGFTGFYPSIGVTFIPVPVKPYFPAFNINELTNFESLSGLPNVLKRKYVGPGINMDSESFPLGNKLIPIGYFTEKDDPCKHQFNGQIVKMYQINVNNIKGLSMSDADKKAVPVLYLFDAQNAIEGQCEECTEG